MKKLEGAARALFFVSACASVFLAALICFFIFFNGVPALISIGPLEFLGGKKWQPLQGVFGILPMITGSLCVTAIALGIGVPAGIFTAVYLARFCPKPLYRLFKPAVDLLAGIPSVVFGFFALQVFVPVVREISGGSGTSMIAAALVLSMMILPTIISVSEAAIRTVPESYFEGSLALGASVERSVFFAVLPAARSGIAAAVILGAGRAFGETMAVLMVAGNQAVMPRGLFKGLRTLTTNIALEMGYAANLHRDALIATAVVLFVFILVINIAFAFTNRK
ncbi:MAG: phosphate ABC transporter permease subunit PstC [Spirochaetaceae bacterium]|nr:phosphate ABC transporter permease subunit PstC [Spirochaetaceae bacterium]